jgi:hypothetical protein
VKLLLDVGASIVTEEVKHAPSHGNIPSLTIHFLRAHHVDGNELVAA